MSASHPPTHLLPPTAAGTPSTPIAAAIKRDIVVGNLVPNQRLVETDLCDEYEANRGAVRVALQELAMEGLVEITRNRGARVRAVSLAEAIEITEVRMVLEGLVAAKAAERVTPQQAAGLSRIGTDMRDAVEASDYQRYSELNVTLHARIREIAQHPTAETIIMRLGAQVVRYQYRLSARRGRPAESLPQHEKIIAAVVAGDPLEAEAAMRDHLRNVAQELSHAPE